MEHMVEFPLESGGTVTVMAATPAGAGDSRFGREVTRGLSTPKVVDEASGTFENALRRVQPAAVAVLEAMREGVNPPNVVEVEFGVQLTAEAGAIIATTGVQANFRVTLTWRRDGEP